MSDALRQSHLSSVRHGRASGANNHRRRSHKKSRTGCLTCRRRRVKCTEERPSCSSCVRRDDTCRYPSLIQLGGFSNPATTQESRSPSEPEHFLPRAHSQPAANAPTPKSTPITTPGASSVELGLAASTSFTIGDIELFHHWQTSTSLNLMDSPEAIHIWQLEMPRIGFRYPFVLYAIFSLAALHRAYLQGQTEKAYIIAATHYHNERLCRFQSEMKRMCPENTEALFAWAALNTLYVFAVSREPQDSIDWNQDSNTRNAWRNKILGAEWMPLTRGIQSLMMSWGDGFAHSRLAGLYSLENFFDLEPLNLDLGVGGRALKSCQETWLNDGRAEAYSTTQDTLYRCYAYMCQHQDLNKEPFGIKKSKFPVGPLISLHQFPDEYLTLLKQRQPPALILFAFFGALLHGVRHYWFFEGWGKDIVTVVNEMLGPYWRPWITWPLQVIGEEMQDGCADESSRS